MLARERDELLRIRALGTVDQSVLARVMNALDVEESILDRMYEDETTADRETELRPTYDEGGACEHLAEAVRRADSGDADRVRGVPAGGCRVGAPAALHDLRSRRLLRLVGGHPRHQALARDRTPGDPQLRAGRGVALVLHRRGAWLTLLSGAVMMRRAMMPSARP